MQQLKKDLKLGNEGEIKILEVIKKYFNENIESSVDKFSKYDFYSDNCMYELKTRRNSYEEYPTTIMPYDKILDDIGKKQIFLFNFTDGLYYIEYDALLFEEFEIKSFRRYDRGTIDKLKLYVYIPIKKLIKII